MTTTAWVIGARGLLGSALTRQIRGRAGWKLLEAEPLPWSDPDALEHAAATTTERLLDCSGTWSILWVGGAGVTSTPQHRLDEELGQLNTVLSAIESRLGRSDAAGSLFYASSAGGVYGGSADPPYTERTVPVPISPYGQFKLRAEDAVLDFGKHARVATLIGRIANLYGPGQKLDKMQGLISQLARAQYSSAPTSIFVPLDTMRDYLYVDDCASLLCDAMDELRRTSANEPAHVTKILASGRSATIGELLGTVHALAKGHPHIMLGQSPAASLQAVDLRLRSTVWPHLDRRELTPLPAGMGATMRSVLAELTAPAPAG